MNKREMMLEVLANWVIRKASENGLATPEEIAALPEVAKVVLNGYSCSGFLPVKKE